LSPLHSSFKDSLRSLQSSHLRQPDSQSSASQVLTCAIKKNSVGGLPERIASDTQHDAERDDEQDDAEDDLWSEEEEEEEDGWIWPTAQHKLGGRRGYGERGDFLDHFDGDQSRGDGKQHDGERHDQTPRKVEVIGPHIELLAGRPVIRFDLLLQLLIYGEEWLPSRDPEDEAKSVRQKKNGSHADHFNV